MSDLEEAQSKLEAQKKKEAKLTGEDEDGSSDLGASPKMKKTEKKKK